ncbi:MAG: hypothetical protein MUQ98_12940, partial [Loktanella sp.]|nr:hypothetical protein [Loktanella sp.]
AFASAGPKSSPGITTSVRRKSNGPEVLNTSSASSPEMAVVTVDPASRNVCDNMLVAPLLIAAGIVLSYFSENLWLIIISSMLVGSGLVCSNAPSTQLVLRFSPKGMSAVSTSLDITFARLGGIATVALLAEAQFVYAVPSICLLSLVAVLCALAAYKGFGAEPDTGVPHLI